MKRWVFLSLIISLIVVNEAKSQTTVRLIDPEPFRDWVDRSDVTMPKDIQVKLEKCGGFACVNIFTHIMYFPPAYLNNPGFNDSRSTFYHESGHIFQLENNDEVQSGYPLLDSRCNGVFSFSCAEYFADRFRACANGTQNANSVTCAFINEVGTN